MYCKSAQRRRRWLCATKIFKEHAKRAAEMMRDDIEAMPPVRVAGVRKLHKKDPPLSQGDWPTVAIMLSGSADGSSNRLFPRPVSGVCFLCKGVGAWREERWFFVPGEDERSPQPKRWERMLRMQRR